MTANEAVFSQDELRRRLAQRKVRVTQATLSRDLRELRLVKTADGYKPLGTEAPQKAAVSHLARALREFLLEFRPAGSLLVLKTPPGGAQPLAAAVDAERLPEIAGTIAGDDTILIITASSTKRAALQRNLESLLR